MPTNLFTTHRRPGVLIAPSILAADFAHLAPDAADALASGSDLLHIDIMDAHFVPNLSMGPALVASLRRALPRAFFDVHLMVQQPAPFLAPFVKAGADHLSIHIEVCPPPEARALAARIHDLGCTAGLALNPGTDPRPLLECLDAFDMALVMGVMPGFGGQGFIEACLDALPALRPALRPDQRLEIDGGVTLANAQRLRDAGFDVLVAGTALFGLAPKDRPAAVAALRGPTGRA